MLKKLTKKRIVWTLIISLAFLILALSYYLYLNAFNESYLKQRLVVEINKLVRTEISAPGSIIHSYNNKTITIKNWVINAGKREVLLVIPEMTIVYDVSALVSFKIQSITIKKPKFFLRRERNGKFNFEALLPAGKTSEPLPLAQIEKAISKFFVKNARIEIIDAWIDCRAPGLLRDSFTWQNLHLVIQRQVQGSLRRRSNYQINLNLASDLTGKMAFSGSFNLRDGLQAQGDMQLTFSLEKLLQKLVLPPSLTAHGQIIVNGISLHGLNPTNPGFHFHSKITQTKGRLCWQDICLHLYAIEGSVDLTNDRLHNINLQAAFGDAQLEITNGVVNLDGDLSLPLKVKNLTIDNTLLACLDNLVAVSVDRYYQMLTPGGIINGHGSINRRAGRWYWDVDVGLSQGRLRYDKLQVKAIEARVQLRQKSLVIKHARWVVGRAPFMIIPGGKISLATPISLPKTTIAFNRLHVDHAFWHAVPGLDEVWKFAHPEGWIDGSFTIEGVPSLHNLPQARLYCYNMKAILDEIPYPVLVKAARLNFHNNTLYLEDIHGQSVSCGAPVTVAGKVRFDLKQLAIDYDIDYHIRQVLLDAVAYRTFSEAEDPDSWLKDLQSVWDHLRPEGIIEVEGRVYCQGSSLKKGVPAKKPDFYVTVAAQNVSASYIDFPYPITNIKGKVAASKGIVKFTGITARKGQGKISVSGEIKPEDGGLDVQIVVNGQNIRLDQDLRKAVGTSYQEAWEQFSPVGCIDLDVYVWKKNIDREVKWRAHTVLREIAASYRGFPYDIVGLKGTLHLAPQNFLLEKLQGRGKSGIGKFRIDGEIKSGNVALDIAAYSLPLDEKLYQALPPEGKRIWRQFVVSGNANARIKLRKKAGEKIRWQTAATFTNLQGYYRPFPYQLQQVRGKIVLSPEHVKIIGCHGQSQNSSIHIGGFVQGEQMLIRIAAEHLPLDDKLYRSLPSALKKVWNMFAPQGPMDIYLTMQKNHKGKNGYSARLVPRGCSLQYRKFPYRVFNLRPGNSDKRSAIHIDGKNIEFNNITGQNGAAAFVLNGGMYYIKDNLSEIKALFEIDIQASKLAIDKQLSRALYQYFPRLITGLGPHGHIALLKLKIKRYQSPQEYLRYAANAIGMKIVTKKGAVVEELGGDVTLSGYAYDDKYHAQGEIDNGKVVFKKLAATEIKSKIKFFNNYLVLHPIKGKFFQGNLQGSLVFDTSAYGAYKGLLISNNACLGKLTKVFQKNKKNSDISGTLNAEIAFQGNLASTSTLTGKGQMFISNASIWQFPIFLAMLDVFSLPSKPPAFHEGYINFSLANQRFVIAAMKFHSSVLSISGTGNIDFDTNLDLTLLTHLTSDLVPRIPLVDKMWDDLRSGIFAFEVKGTLDDPSITPRNLLSR